MQKSSSDFSTTYGDAQVAANVTDYLAARLNHPLIAVLSKPLKVNWLGRAPEQTQREKADATLLAMKEFRRYLEGVEKDLSRTSKKFSNREIAQGVGFVAAGIHEALNYLEIVKKVIVKTERVVAKKNIGSEHTTVSTNPP